MSVASKFDASSITQLAGITNYSDWARVCASALKSTGLARYVRGSSVKLDDTELKDYYLWCAWDEQTVELILRTVTKDVYDQIKQDVPYSTSHQLWDGMRKLFVNSGILSQVNYLRRALRHIFPPDEPYGPTIRAIRSDLQRVYDVGSPSIDDMMSILMLQALTPHHADVARAIEHSNAIDHRSIQRRLDTADIRSLEEAEFSPGRKTINVAAATTYKGSNTPRIPCEHCNRTNHASARCWSKFPHLKPKRTARDTTQPSASAPPTDSVKRPEHTNVALNETHVEEAAAAIGHDSDINYWSALTTIDTCSVDWGLSSTHSANVSFFLDSASSCHLSPDRNDFTSFQTTAPRAIKGINGSCIHAVGTGDVRIQLSKGRVFTLRHVLYVPHAAMHLISIGRLCDSGYSVAFSADSCSVSLASGACTLIAIGDRTLNNLFALSATLSRHLPTR
ncbi:hypothetical protein EW146_g8204 [Bondarzewia mesenterica]|uniref:Retrovirus-related Pol polyprotein from transposon TNT 1-94-like beta-barrel domain-containing protein n=1 Tax=Bondarzewia mesenterica TaxID=1095465 RepID=A0A4S4LI41_9AGAM|nr:hypothetical protein EW146_g8204 [Bondarzewia mesenterica]